MVAGVGNAPTNNQFMRLACDFRISLLNMVGQKRIELLSFVYKTNILAIKILP